MLGEKQHENRIRFEPTRFSRAWASVRKHLTPPTHPSTTSESAMGSGMYAETDMFGYDDQRAGGGGRNTLPLEVIDPVAARARKRAGGSGGGVGVVGSLLKNRKGGGGGTGGGDSSRRGLTSAHQSGSRYEGDDDEGPWEPVSTVVVDNDFEQVIPLAARSDSGSTRTPGGKEGSSLFPGTNKSEGLDVAGQRRDSAVISELDGEGGGGAGTTTAKRDEDQRNWLQKTAAYELLVITVWPSIKYFFDSTYIDPQKEYAFMRETWFQTKMGAMASAVFFLISWALSTGLQPVYNSFIWITYMGIGGFFTIPLIALIAFDFPRRRNWIWQPMLAGASWVLADVLIVEAHRCGLFSTNNTCGRKNFINMLGFAFGQPVLALLAMRQNRFYAMLGASQWLILAGALLMTQDNAPTLFYRNMVNFALFHAFIIGTSFLRERGDRHMFEMRQQLKMQFRATQSAQVMERKASDSKRRFVSYIFHEVRVPLNTALLAVQNLEGENVFRHVQADQGEMVHGLVRSLTTMEKVLNDVLSFNRMEAGKFAQARKPFDFHKSINLVALSHRPQAMSSGIELLVELDPEIDSLGSSSPSPSSGLGAMTQGQGGIFIGDEMRLRQITSNLVSNSIKFTESGSVRIVTKLIYPRLDLNAEGAELDTPLREAAENLHHLQQQEADIEKGSIHLESLRHSTDPKYRESHSHPHPYGAGHHKDKDKDKDHNAERQKEKERERRKAIVRVEIHDTGIGLKKDDLDDQRLFSPYVQTEIGRRQGGKGSGLGLALVRQIVRLSNGRLGVDSEFGKGSVFWFELPYALPSPSTSSTTRPSSGSGGGGGGRDRSGETPTMSPRMGTLPPALAVPTIDEESASASPSGETPFDDEKLDPLEAIEHREMHSPQHLSKHPHPTAPQQQQERPRMSETESTIPLLSASDPNRKDSVPSTEEVIMTTYPPPDSGSSADTSSPFEHTEAALLAMQQQQRRESEWTAESSGSGAGSGSAAGADGASRRPSEVTAEAPLCAFVVDDDRLTRMLMSRMLTRLGHQVTTAENGKMALEMIKDSYEGKAGIPKFDVCFLDNQMPFMSGVEVVRAVREMGNPLYVVGCTGNALREDQDEYLSAGADGIIPKPVHQKSVLEQIKLARKRIAGETQPKAIQSIY